MLLPLFWFCQHWTSCSTNFMTLDWMEMKVFVFAAWPVLCCIYMWGYMVRSDSIYPSSNFRDWMCLLPNTGHENRVPKMGWMEIRFFISFLKSLVIAHGEWIFNFVRVNFQCTHSCRFSMWTLSDILNCLAPSPAFHLSGEHSRRCAEFYRWFLFRNEYFIWNPPARIFSSWNISLTDIVDRTRFTHL